MKGLARGPLLHQPSLLFQTHFEVDLFDFVRTLEKLGFILNRAHRKENDGLGKTEQLLLVYEKGKEPVKRNDRWDVEHAFFGNTGKREGYIWAIRVDLNRDGAGRVPAHLMVACANPKPAEPVMLLNVSDDGAILIGDEVVTDKEILCDLTMVRISVNLYPNMKHLIPKWVEMRPRHGEKVRGIISDGLKSF